MIDCSGPTVLAGVEKDFCGQFHLINLHHTNRDKEQPKKVDVWSLSMVLFCLVNPKYKDPYHNEAEKARRMYTWNSFIMDKTTCSNIPICNGRI